MIIRIVKMTFREDATADFLQIFESTKEQIRNFEGCHHLKLLHDIASPHIYFTYSKWQSESALHKYRKSELFADIWPRTKALFAARTEVYTTKEIADLP